MKIVSILLAAGGSTRMGKLKQVLPVHGHPMARFCAIQILSAPIDRLIVVTGNGEDRVSETLASLDLDLCTNPLWQDGIGSSIRSGVAEVKMRYPDCDGILIALADQPTVPIAHFVSLIQLLRRHSDIVASGYEGKNGVPVVFGRDYFAQLLAIEDAAGASRVLQNNLQNLKTVQLAHYLDIDTPDDYSQLQASAGDQK